MKLVTITLLVVSFASQALAFLPTIDVGLKKCSSLWTLNAENKPQQSQNPLEQIQAAFDNFVSQLQGASKVTKSSSPLKTKSEKKEPELPPILADVVIIGAGMSGLACANDLVRSGINDILVLEKADDVGGRVRTDEVDGFLLDRGFQVFIEAYPRSKRFLNYDKLDLCQFLPGAQVLTANKDGSSASFSLLSDPFRRPQDTLPTLLSPAGQFFDKVRVGLLRFDLSFASSVESILKDPKEYTTEEYLKKVYGFSDDIVDRFFRPFFGGIFLSTLDQQSSRLFRFVMKMFSEGAASLPRDGMGAIPRQMAANLPPGVIKLNTQVTKIKASISTAPIKVTSGGVEMGASDPAQVRLSTKSGETVVAKCVVIAADLPAVCSLLEGRGLNFDTAKYTTDKRASSSSSSSLGRGSTCLYYAIDGPPPSQDPILFLNGVSPIGSPAYRAAQDGRGCLVNNVCFPNMVSAAYAPPGKSLASVTVVGTHRELDDKVLDETVRGQLGGWFPATGSTSGSVEDWRLLRIYRIPYAQPTQVPPTLPGFEGRLGLTSEGSSSSSSSSGSSASPLLVCGDFTGSPTLDGALYSGERAARMVKDYLKMSGGGGGGGGSAGGGAIAGVSTSKGGSEASPAAPVPAAA